MSDIAKWMGMSKQQLTKLVSRLVDLGFVIRGSNPKDRRVIIIKATKSADNYVKNFLNNEMGYFKLMVEALEEHESNDFKDALEKLQNILIKFDRYAFWK